MLLKTTLLDKLGTWLLNGFPAHVWRVLPVHDSSIPAPCLASFTIPLPQLTMINQSCVRCILLCHRLPHHNLVQGDLLPSDFEHRSATEMGARVIEQSLLTVVPGVSLVVELHIVEVNGGPNLLVHRIVPAVLVEVLLEVRGLGCVGDDVGG